MTRLKRHRTLIFEQLEGRQLLSSVPFAPPPVPEISYFESYQVSETHEVIERQESRSETVERSSVRRYGDRLSTTDYERLTVTTSSFRQEARESSECLKRIDGNRRKVVANETHAVEIAFSNETAIHEREATVTIVDPPGVEWRMDVSSSRRDVVLTEYGNESLYAERYSGHISYARDVYGPSRLYSIWQEGETSISKESRQSRQTTSTEHQFAQMGIDNNYNLWYSISTWETGAIVENGHFREMSAIERSGSRIDYGKEFWHHEIFAESASAYHSEWEMAQSQSWRALTTGGMMALEGYRQQSETGVREVSGRDVASNKSDYSYYPIRGAGGGGGEAQKTVTEYHERQEYHRESSEQREMKRNRDSFFSLLGYHYLFGSDLDLPLQRF